MDKVFVVGMGEDGWSGLAPEARRTVESADLLMGTSRLLAMVPPGKAEQKAVNPGTQASLQLIESSLGQLKVVVLASGDPGFYGIGKVLVGRLGKERVEILPHISSVQLAFARLGESWEDAAFLSVHGRSLDGLASAVRRSGKVAILTDEKNTPAAIARALLASGIAGYRAYVCENLGSPDERVHESDLTQLAGAVASPLNVLVLVRDSMEAPKVEWRHGIPDQEFHQRKPQRGLITKLEVRMTALALLGLREDSVIWDVGAGSGSVSIEAALLARGGTVYAVERDPESVDLIRQNISRFGTTSVAVIPGLAPDALVDLPDPDCVFVGGSGGRLADILEVACRRLRGDGRIVVSAASLETVDTATQGLRERAFSADVTLMQVSRSKDLAGLTHLEALNPVFLVTGARESATEGESEGVRE